MQISVKLKLSLEMKPMYLFFEKWNYAFWNMLVQTSALKLVLKRVKTKNKMFYTLSLKKVSIESSLFIINILVYLNCFIKWYNTQLKSNTNYMETLVVKNIL